MNLPVGAAALALIVVFLAIAPRAAPTRGLISGGGAAGQRRTCCLLLLLSWGGSAYPWMSGQIAGAGQGLPRFVRLLVRSSDGPRSRIMAPGLFRNRVFVVGAAVISAGRHGAVRGRRCSCR